MKCQMPKHDEPSQPCGDEAEDFLIIDFEDGEGRNIKYRVNFCELHYYTIMRIGEIGMYRLWEDGKLYGQFEQSR